MKQLVALVVAGAALAACTSGPKARVRSALIDMGVDRSVAQCMSDRMVNRLSYGQLMRLAQLGDLRGRRVGDMRVTELIRRVRTLGDPQILEVVSTTGLGCAIAS